MTPITKKLTLFMFYFWLAMLFFLFAIQKNNECVGGQAAGEISTSCGHSVLDQCKEIKQHTYPVYNYEPLFHVLKWTHALLSPAH